MAGTDQTRKLITGGPVVILVEPQLGENIGMVARAMANFGLSELRIVNPRDGWPSDKARAAASRADHVIDGAVVYEALSDAVIDLHLLMATTARARDMTKPVVGPKAAVADMRAAIDAGQVCGMMFGRERWGLHNDEVAIADKMVTFPVNPAFASLNIAQAVLLMAYEWMNAASGGALPFEPPEAAPASKQDVLRLNEHLLRALDEADYFYPQEKRERMALALNNIFTGAGLSEAQVRTLRGAIAALERRWAKVKRHKSGQDAQ